MISMGQRRNWPVLGRFISSGMLCSVNWLIATDNAEEHEAFVGRVAQLIQQLATSWTVQGSNPGGDEIFRTCPDWPWGPLSLLYNGYRIFPGGKERPGRDADPSPTSSAVVMKEQNYTSTPLWNAQPVQSFSACTRVHFTFTFTFTVHLVTVYYPDQQMHNIF